MKDKLPFVLMLKVLEVVSDSGANQTEARCALQAALAMLREVNLESKPTLTIQT
jgi:hypothetical protein